MFKYLKKYWLYVVLAPLFMIGEVLMDLVQPGMMSTIVDEGVLGLSNNNVGDLSIVISVGVRMIGVVFLGGSFGVLSGVFTNLASQNFGNDMRKDCFGKIMSLSLEQTDRFSTGSLITRVTNDVTQVQNMVAQCIRGFVRMMMFFIGGIFCMLSLDLSFGIVVLCALPLVMIVVMYFIAKVTPLYGILQKKLDKVNSVMQENVTGARVVKACVKEEYEKKRFFGANDELVGTQLNVLVLLSYMTPLMNIIMNLAVVAVIYVGSVQVKGGTVTPGNVMAAITYLTQILNSVMMLAMIFQTVSRGTASMKRLEEVLGSVPVISDGKSDETPDEEMPEQKRGKIEFRHVSFSYPQAAGEAVLKDISLIIRPGETFAILGATGCGKSSLVSLIPRFYDVTEGEVLLDGKNVKDFDLETLRKMVGIVPQKAVLFKGTIEDNLRWGKKDATEEELWEALETAQAAEFVRERADGLQAKIDQGGKNLSGGQRQRLTIARALVGHPGILILDDSASALDFATDAALRKALREMKGNPIVFIVSQRTSSIRHADQIIVLDDGMVAGIGTHQELLENCPVYQEIHYSQFDRKEERADA